MAMLGRVTDPFNYKIDMPSPAAPAPEKPKINWAGILADALYGMAGQPGVFAQRQERQRAEQTALERGDQQYRRQRADSAADWEREKSWQIANRVPQTWEDNGGNRWKMGDDGKPVEIFHDNIPKMQAVQGFDDNGNPVLRWVQQPQAPTVLKELPPGVVPVGGPTQPASGSFLYP